MQDNAPKQATVQSIYIHASIAFGDSCQIGTLIAIRYKDDYKRNVCVDEENFFPTKKELLDSL